MTRASIHLHKPFRAPGFTAYDRPDRGGLVNTPSDSSGTLVGKGVSGVGEGGGGGGGTYEKKRKRKKGKRKRKGKNGEQTNRSIVEVS